MNSPLTELYYILHHILIGPLASLLAKIALLKVTSELHVDKTMGMLCLTLPASQYQST